MTTIKTPQKLFTDTLSKAGRADSHAGKTITTTEAKKALAELQTLSPEQKVAAVEAFLSSNGAKKLSEAARDVLRDFVTANDRSHPPALPIRPPPHMKFMEAVQHAIDHGKVRGQVTKGEIEKAFKHIEGLGVNVQAAIAQQLLDGPHADKLSKAARKVVEERANVSIGTTEAVGEEGGMVTLAIPEDGGGSITEAVSEIPGVVTMAFPEGGATTEAVGEEGGGAVTLAIPEDGGASTEAVGEEGGSITEAISEIPATTMAMGEEGGASTEAVGEEGGGAVTLAIPEDGGGAVTAAMSEIGVTTMALGEEGGSTEAVGEEGGSITEAISEIPVTTQALGEEGGGGATTEAIGEEGGGAVTMAIPENGGGITTEAIGEE